ncbi:MAG: sigma 54-interacting transcriptional regulator, partial [Fibrobacterota bacterium]
QAKLLRVLQEGEFERVGGSETIKVDVRVVAATNRDLEKAVREETFRSDLYFRLCVVPIILAPLRERPEDIPLLASEFLRRFNDSSGTSLKFGDDAVSLIRSCAFPGNIRELESCVRRTAAFAEGSVIHADDFACRNDSCLSVLLTPRRTPPMQGDGFRPLPILPFDARVPDPDSVFADSDSVYDDEPSEISTEDTPERRRLVDAMEKAGWVQARAARLLGLTPRQICYALRKHGVEVKKF